MGGWDPPAKKTKIFEHSEFSDQMGPTMICVFGVMLNQGCYYVGLPEVTMRWRLDRGQTVEVEIECPPNVVPMRVSNVHLYGM